MMVAQSGKYAYAHEQRSFRFSGISARGNVGFRKSQAISRFRQQRVLPDFMLDVALPRHLAGVPIAFTLGKYAGTVFLACTFPLVFQQAVQG